MFSTKILVRTKFLSKIFSNLAKPRTLTTLYSTFFNYSGRKVEKRLLLHIFNHRPELTSHHSGFFFSVKFIYTNNEQQKVSPNTFGQQT